MRNLAGDHKAETYVTQELSRCGVPLVIIPIEDRGEVPSPVGGQLGEFHFFRAWCYWVVTGRVPIEVAEEIYANPIGKKDVRAGGDCGCVPPTSYVSHWFAPDGRLLVSIEEKAGIDRLIASNLITQGKVDEDFVFADPEVFPHLGRRFVTCYHIDSQEGLDFFVETLKKHNLV